MSNEPKKDDQLTAIEAALVESLPPDGPSLLLDEAMRYAVLAGGKRLRPRLLLLTAEMLSLSESRQQAALQLAAAVEIIHSYSLVHDDLPCMDDDELRRGQPTVHVQYGYAEAVLVGDALLNRAFELILNVVDQADHQDKAAIARAGALIARQTGREGMVAGQMFDIQAADLIDRASADPSGEDKLETLIELQRLKTGALLTAPVLAAAALCDADEKTTEILHRFASALGLAFQIRDDILDESADEAVLGKSPGKDARDNKLTFVTLLGMSEAEDACRQQTAEAILACQELDSIGYDSRELWQLTAALEIRRS